MGEILPFFIILFAGLLFSELFRKLHLPWVVALILGGIIIGPFGLKIFHPNETIELLGQIGLVFLMFMAGLETKLSGFYRLEKRYFSLPIINGGFPFIVGFGIGYFFGYDTITSLLFGAVLMSSSVAVIFPSLRANKWMGTKLGKSIISTTVLEDIVSLVIISVIFQTASPASSIPLPAFYILLLITLIALRWVIARIRLFFTLQMDGKKDLFEQELRAIFVILIGTVVAFELLGLHPMIAGFFAGIVLSDSISSDILKEKLRVISYGIFIPIFFVLVGTKTDFTAIIEARNILLLTVVIIIGALLSKFFGGMLAGKLNGFSYKQGALIGVATIPQLSTAIAVSFSGLELGIISAELAAMFIALSIVTTFVSPILVRFVSNLLRNE